MQDFTSSPSFNLVRQLFMSLFNPGSLQNSTPILLKCCSECFLSSARISRYLSRQQQFILIQFSSTSNLDFTHRQHTKQQKMEKTFDQMSDVFNQFIKTENRLTHRQHTHSTHETKQLIILIWPTFQFKTGNKATIYTMADKTKHQQMSPQDKLKSNL